jgi:hypothetical protein
MRNPKVRNLATVRVHQLQEIGFVCITSNTDPKCGCKRCVCLCVCVVGCVWLGGWECWCLMASGGILLKVSSQNRTGHTVKSTGHTVQSKTLLLTQSLKRHSPSLTRTVQSTILDTESYRTRNPKRYSWQNPWHFSRQDPSRILAKKRLQHLEWQASPGLS